MSAQERTELIERENGYLLSRKIELETELLYAVNQLNMNLAGIGVADKLKLLTASELAEKFQVSENRIQYLAQRHGLPVIKWGKHQDRYDPVAIRQWLNRGGKINEDEAVDQSGLQLIIS